jgi:hypothetical protein
MILLEVNDVCLHSERMGKIAGFARWPAARTVGAEPVQLPHAGAPPSFVACAKQPNGGRRRLPDATPSRGALWRRSGAS